MNLKINYKIIKLLTPKVHNTSINLKTKKFMKTFVNESEHQISNHYNSLIRVISPSLVKAAHLSSQICAVKEKMPAMIVV